MKKVPVLEIFGPTIQGEGAVIGQKTMFVRTAGCDYSCSWCDSKFTWDGSQKENITQMTSEEIFEKLDDLAKDNYSHVTISGGNPLLLKNLEAFVYAAKEKGLTLAVETQGSKFQDWLTMIDEVTISPKPPSSNMKTNFETLSEILNKLDTRTVTLKIVIFTDDDLEYAKNVHVMYPDIPLYLQVGNPYLDHHVENHTEKLLKRYETLVEKVIVQPIFNDVKVLPQLHTLLWSNKQGV